MITCLLEGMHRAVIKPINFNKLREITQSTTKYPALFHSRLGEAMRKYTTPQPKTPEDLAILAIYFTANSHQTLSKSSKKLEQDPETLLPTLLKMAFKPFMVFKGDIEG
jgi:hypothetical protein